MNFDRHYRGYGRTLRDLILMAAPDFNTYVSNILAYKASHKGKKKSCS